jgi:hypothetical protein
MKRNIFTRVLKSLFVILFVVGIGEVGWGQIVAYDLTASSAATAGIAANYPGQGRVMNISGITSSNYTSGNGQTCYAWNAVGGDSWATSAFSTAGYISMTGSFQMKGNTNIGPRDFKVQYSLNGSSWTDVTMTKDGSVIANITLTNGLQTFNFSLPSSCDNKTTVYVRWVQNSTYQINGVTPIGLTSTYNASLKGVSIAGNAFAAPSTQASNISIISITPTTIKIGCTNGNGNNRIIKINTTNSFTDPVNDYNPTGNTTYGGTGEQVVYNGSASSVTVTVPSSTNVYWFRVYEYNKMDALTRYITSTASKNPRECKLETIHSPTSANIGLITATLGATITTPTTGTITERGVYWSSTSPVDESANLEPETSLNGGVYTISVAGVDRGTTIYYKGYVTNESGTILSPEASFINIPIFTGTGNWETGARWNVQEVPGSGLSASINGSEDDSPIINGTCTLTSDIVCNNLTINTNRILNVNAVKSLTVNGTLTNNGSTAGLKLLSSAAGTGSLMHNTNNVDATVQRYIAGSSLLTAKKYHLVSVPVTGSLYLSGVWLDSYLFTYLEGNDTWFNWNDPVINELDPHKGAMVYYPNWYGNLYKTYNITGKLNNGSYSPTITTSGNGYNLIPNPYPSAIDWDLVAKTGVDDAIWIFNPKDGFTNYESYIGGVSNGDVTNIIPEGQAFFVKATGSGLTFTNAIRLHEQTMKFFKKSTSQISNVLNLKIAGNGGGDGIAVRFVDDATSGYDKKYDAAKFYGDKTIPQLSSYTASDPNLLSISGLPAGQSSTIVPLRLDMDYTGALTFTAKGMESFNETSIELEDKQLNKFIDLRINPVYTFDHTATDAVDRFVLHFSSVMLGTSKPDAQLQSKVTVSNHEINLQYTATANGKLIATVYDLQGRVIKQVKLSGKGNDHIYISTSGAYLVKLYLPSGVETHKIVVR